MKAASRGARKRHDVSLFSSLELTPAPAAPGRSPPSVEKKKREVKLRSRELARCCVASRPLVSSAASFGTPAIATASVMLMRRSCHTRAWW